MALHGGGADAAPTPRGFVMSMGHGPMVVAARGRSAFGSSVCVGWPAASLRNVLRWRRAAARRRRGVAITRRPPPRMRCGARRKIDPLGGDELRRSGAARMCAGVAGRRLSAQRTECRPVCMSSVSRPRIINKKPGSNKKAVHGRYLTLTVRVHGRTCLACRMSVTVLCRASAETPERGPVERRVSRASVRLCDACSPRVPSPTCRHGPHTTSGQARQRTWRTATPGPPPRQSTLMTLV